VVTQFSSLEIIDMKFAWLAKMIRD
jgi:hypothetical protein